MAKPIRTARDCATELSDYISMYALTSKELKSVAQSIGYPLGIFKPFKRNRLNNELVFLYAFIGTVTLKGCLSNFPGVSKDDETEIVQLYVDRLLNRWMPKSMFPYYKARLEIWGQLFNNLQDEEDYQKSISILTRTFYEFLMKTPCDEMKEAMLTLRFNGYIRNFIGSIENMLEETRL